MHIHMRNWNALHFKLISIKSQVNDQELLGVGPRDPLANNESIRAQPRKRVGTHINNLICIRNTDSSIFFDNCLIFYIA